MENILQGMTVGFREGLETFLIITLMLQYLDKIDHSSLKKNIWYGMFAGILVSLGIGGILYLLTKIIGGTDQFAQIWESATSLLALALITTFIFWMIRHGRSLTSYVHQEVKENLSQLGLFLVAMTMVAREGAEIVLFAFAGEYPNDSIIMGLILAMILAILIFHSLVKVNIRIIFVITLAYLILQAGYLLGYGIHEGLEALKGARILSEDSLLMQKAFNLSETIFNHKSGSLGLPLHVIFGWYSKPEWLAFITQYLYTTGIFMYWFTYTHKKI